MSCALFSNVFVSESLSSHCGKGLPCGGARSFWQLNSFQCSSTCGTMLASANHRFHLKTCPTLPFAEWQDKQTSLNFGKLRDVRHGMTVMVSCVVRRVFNGLRPGPVRAKPGVSVSCRCVMFGATGVKWNPLRSFELGHTACAT